MLEFFFFFFFSIGSLQSVAIGHSVRFVRLYYMISCPACDHGHNLNSPFSCHLRDPVVSYALVFLF